MHHQCSEIRQKSPSEPAAAPNAALLGNDMTLRHSLTIFRDVGSDMNYASHKKREYLSGLPGNLPPPLSNADVGNRFKR
jgi:hypothetical protein